MNLESNAKLEIEKNIENRNGGQLIVREKSVETGWSWYEQKLNKRKVYKGQKRRRKLLKYEEKHDLDLSKQ